MDENTRLFAKYYEDFMNSDSTTTKKMVPILPIVEPLMTPLHEVSKSFPDYVKFGPILPKSADFSLVTQSKHSSREASRLVYILQVLTFHFNNMCNKLRIRKRW